MGRSDLRERGREESEAGRGEGARDLPLRQVWPAHPYRISGQARPYIRINLPRIDPSASEKGLACPPISYIRIGQTIHQDQPTHNFPWERSGLPTDLECQKISYINTIILVYQQNQSRKSTKQYLSRSIDRSAAIYRCDRSGLPTDLVYKDRPDHIYKDQPTQNRSIHAQESGQTFPLREVWPANRYRMSTN